MTSYARRAAAPHRVPGGYAQASQGLLQRRLAEFCDLLQPFEGAAKCMLGLQKVCLVQQHGFAQLGQGVGEPVRFGIRQALSGHQAFAQGLPMFGVAWPAQAGSCCSSR